MSVDPAIRDHQAWLGYLQPDGLVVSPAALVDSQVVLDRAGAPLQELLSHVVELPHGEDTIPAIAHLGRFVCEFLGWPDDCLFGRTTDRPIPEALKIPLRDFGETLEPKLALSHARPDDPQHPWIMLVQELPPGTELDEGVESKLSGWSASPSRRFERLLREAEVPIGLISSGTHLRLIYAPHGENVGTLTFPVAAMTEVAGRPILAAFHLLLSRYRLFAAPTAARLPALLKRSRDYQARVSTALAGQVLDALYDLLRGFQAANDHTHGKLLKEVLANNPDQVYSGLLTVLMRLVFLLYAEDRGLMPGSDLYVRNYSVHGLFERLRADAEQYQDTMEHRYGAWAQLLALFRVIHQGCEHPLLKVPAREGHLFDPRRFSFLEGTVETVSDAPDGAAQLQVCLPFVPDGTIYRVLEKLLMLDGERLSYRTLDVEQIGSVYETMMGFRLELARGTTIALKPAKSHGAPVPVDLDKLLTVTSKRVESLAEWTDYKLPAAMAAAVKAAESVDDLLAALERRIARNATPQPVSIGTMVLVPTDERRRSGSHYTPRTLTEPIVRTTLKPILEQLGPQPTAEQILALKICDLAMGSGAFLVESCRQLADALVTAWATHSTRPPLPADEDDVLHARRLIAQRCLYGVDRNPMAVELAKLSLWLATLAKDHPFTFVDHLLRCGDSLVGLTRQQIAAFHWEPKDQKHLLEQDLTTQIARATEFRTKILAASESTPYADQQRALAVADEALDRVRRVGDLVIAAFFSAEKSKQRDANLREYLSLITRVRGKEGRAQDVSEWIGLLKSLHGGDHPIQPFHWQIEFPEVFTVDAKGKPTGGFDTIVGNPPFAGKNTLINGNREGYLDWLKTLHEESHGNADLVAHFFRRAFNLLRDCSLGTPARPSGDRATKPNGQECPSYGGCFGLIATNTIGQGDTRSTGLRWICTHGGTIYAARKRLKWPGQAAVVVSVVNVCRGPMPAPFTLDGREVPIITAYLFHAGGHDDPATLDANAGKSFQGSIVLGMGFTFDDTDRDGIANPLALMRDLIAKDNRNAERIFPYLGGEELLNSPTHTHHRFVINFADWPLRRVAIAESWTTASELQRAAWLRTGLVPQDYRAPVAADFPDLLRIIEEKVKPIRDRDNRESYRRYWWQFAEKRGELFAAMTTLDRVLLVPFVGTHLASSFVPATTIAAGPANVLAIESLSAFAVIQSRVHIMWATFLTSSFKDDLRYTPSNCFETFPFPTGVLEHAAGASPTTDNRPLTTLENAGREYYEFRAALMVRNNEGLTKTYNRFHDPHETSPDILQLRALHAAMDRAVLEAYGWHDLAQTATCEFLLDYEDDEDEDEGSGTRSPGTGRQKKKPWRYRWPDPFRDEVLARLLELNKDRAAEERRSGAAAASNPKTPKPRKSRKPPSSNQDPTLFDQQKRLEKGRK